VRALVGPARGGRSGQAAKTGSTDVAVGLVTPAVVAGGGGWAGKARGWGVRLWLGAARSDTAPLLAWDRSPWAWSEPRATFPAVRERGGERFDRARGRWRYERPSPGRSRRPRSGRCSSETNFERERMLVLPSMPRQPPTAGGCRGGTSGGTRRAPSPEPPTNPRKRHESAKTSQACTGDRGRLPFGTPSAPFCNLSCPQPQAFDVLAAPGRAAERVLLGGQRALRRGGARRRRRAAPES